MTQLERDIIVRCQRGDRNAFRWVVQTHQRMLFSLGLKMLCDEEEAKDMVQDTFIRVWQHIGEYDLEYTFSTWLYTIASRLCMDRLKHKKRIVAQKGDEMMLRYVASDSNNHLMLENQEWVALVRTMAEGLSDKQRLVFTLCQLEGFSSEEVEKITGMDGRQISSNLYIARQTIRQRLRKLGYE